MRAAVILWIGHYSCDSNGEYEATEVILRRFKEFCGTISGLGKTEVSGWTAKQLMAHLRKQLDSSRLKRESVGLKSRKTDKYMIRAGTGIKHSFGMKNKAVIDMRKLERLENDRKILQSPQVQTALARAGQQGARAPMKATGYAEEESSSSSSSSSAAASAMAKGQKEEEEVRPGTTYACPERLPYLGSTPHRSLCFKSMGHALFHQTGCLLHILNLVLATPTQLIFGEPQMGKISVAQTAYSLAKLVLSRKEELAMYCSQTNNMNMYYQVRMC
eukprot:g1914.t1